MYILYRIPYPYFFSQHESVGGHVAHSLGIVGGLVEEGHDVTVLAHEGKEMFEEAGAEFERVRGDGTGPVWRQAWLYRFFRKSRRLLRQRPFDYTYTRYSASAAPHLWWTFRREAVPSILEINSLGSQRVESALLRHLEARAIRAPSLSLVVSEALKGWIERHLGPSAASEIRVIQNGVDDDRFRPVPEGQQEGTFRCAFAGLIKPDYGLECLVDAAKILPDDEVSFHIFGAGPFEPNLREYASGVPNAVLEGEIPFAEVPDRLHEMDCLVYTTSSKWSFQSPTKLFEYMAIGRPIVAARTSPTVQILENGKFGRLFELESPSALRDAVLDVREAYPRALQRARAAQAEVRNRHQWVHRVRSILSEVRKRVNEEG